MFSKSIQGWIWNSQNLTLHILDRFMSAWYKLDTLTSVIARRHKLELFLEEGISVMMPITGLAYGVHFLGWLRWECLACVSVETGWSSHEQQVSRQQSSMICKPVHYFLLLPRVSAVLFFFFFSFLILQLWNWKVQLTLSFPSCFWSCHFIFVIETLIHIINFLYFK